MVTAAALHGIDLSLMWATIDRPAGGSARVRQVCLCVPGSGKTAMLIVSGPGGGGGPEVENAERMACIRAAIDHLSHERQAGRKEIRIAQALPDPREPHAVRAFLGAGFLKVGDLAYLRRPRGPSAAPRPEGPWPAGLTVRPVRGVSPLEPDRVLLAQALDRSYEQTLDCPELCGLRDTADVLESHLATGECDPRLWWLVLDGPRPLGCMLLSRCPDQGTVELVYLGLAPELRARGVAARLLAMGIAEVEATCPAPITCAVDLRNEPALRLYHRLGFREFARRIALVQPIG
jgi:ribosomal protein S18 acetylase RimI-like enzyme